MTPFYVSPDGKKLRSELDAGDVIGEALQHRAEIRYPGLKPNPRTFCRVIPVSREERRLTIEAAEKSA